MINFDNKLFKKLCIVSAPSGAGKTSLIKKVCKKQNISVCISDTSRKPREGEINEVDYNFIEKEVFLKKIKNDEYIEYALVHGNYYGTSVESAIKLLEKNEIIIFEIDYQGAEIIKNKIPFSRSIFILPPSLRILEKRLRDRGTDTEDVITKRLKNAKLEISKAYQYDYVLVNDDFEVAEKKLLSYFLDVDMTVDAEIRKEPLIDKDF